MKINFLDMNLEIEVTFFDIGYSAYTNAEPDNCYEGESTSIEFVVEGAEPDYLLLENGPVDSDEIYYYIELESRCLDFKNENISYTQREQLETLVLKEHLSDLGIPYHKLN